MRVALLACVLAASFAAELHPLAKKVVIRRDTYGVPHILAETEEAAAFAMGFAQAEDHAVEIARRFVSARGELARRLGSGADSDFEMRRYGNHEVARSSFPNATPLMQSMMNAYAAGFNLYVEQNREKLPDWIPAFEGVDVFAQGRAEIMRFAFSRAQASIRAVQQKYAGASAAAAGDGDGGSNMWALTPSRTASGKAILLGNPHQPWTALYWEAQVTVPGKLNMFGGTFAGRPVLTTGFNEHLGWTHTVNLPDLDDIYVLTLDKTKPDHYVFEGSARPLERREITVDVKGGPAQKRVYWYSHLGPIVHRSPDKAFAIKSAILDAYRYFDQWYAFGKAKSWKEFRTLLEDNSLPMFNLTYADVEGNIFYLWNGTVPRRVDDGTDYRAEVPGNTGKYVWREFHPTSDLPQLLNPPGGYVQNCNDPPWWTSLRDRLDPKKYPSYFEPGRTLGLRTQMSLEMLEGREKFSLDDVMRLKFQTKMLLADRVKDDLIRHARPDRALLSPELKAGVEALQAWDNHTSAESRGGVLFQRFWDTYSKAATQPFAQPWEPLNPAKTPSGIADPVLALKHLEDAVRWARTTYGSERVAWGDVHRIRIGDLDLPATGAPGEYGLFRVMQFRPDAGGKRVATGGDGWVTAVEFSRPPRAYSILAYGQTGDLASRHSRDQARLFARHQFKPVWFSESEIKTNLARQYRPGDR